MKCIGIAFVVGIYDGIYGPGTGTFLMLLFTAFCHLSLNDAAGTTKAINLTTNISALAVFLSMERHIFLWVLRQAAATWLEIIWEVIALQAMEVKL